MKYIREYTDKDLQIVADMLSKNAFVRDDSSKPRIKLNEKEYHKMFLIVYGALLSARWNHAEPSVVQGILDYAEFMFNNTFPKYEGYRSIYIPLDIVLDRTLTETRIDEDKVRRHLELYED